MRIRFRIGPFTFGRTGIRFSSWSRGTGVSIPITNRKKARSFGKVKIGSFSFFFRGKSKNIKEQQKLHANAYEPWTKESDERLVYLFRKGASIKELSEIFGRTQGAIRSRINKLLL
jgi:hypothetical protein